MDRADHQTRFKPEGKEALSNRGINIKLEKEIDQIVRGIPVAIRGKWLRRVIKEAALKDFSITP